MMSNEEVIQFCKELKLKGCESLTDDELVRVVAGNLYERLRNEKMNTEELLEDYVNGNPNMRNSDYFLIAWARGKWEAGLL